jgi:hypothetical protein
MKVLRPVGDPGERAEAAALTVLGPLHLRGLVRPSASGRGTDTVRGPSLGSLGSLTWAAAAAVLAPVADALAGMHRAGWVHGDVSPANVVVGPDGAGVLVDLGCAAPVADARATGTPGFVAPEVEAGAPVTPAADVWSLAAVVASTVGQLPAEGTLALRRARSDDPADRPGAAAIAALLHLHASPPAVAATTLDYGPKPPTPAEPAPPRRRRRWPVAVAAAAVVAATAVAARPTPAATPCAPVPAHAALTGDPDGDGCDTAAAWVGGVLTIALTPNGAPSRIAVGAPGDVVLLGDWDCDGVDTPATYRPSTGVATTWSRWPHPGAPSAPSAVSTHRTGGSAVVDTDDRSGCDRVLVTPAR